MDEISPCEIIKIIAPVRLHGVWIIMAAITRPMWLTDEYAISDFRSVCRMQIKLVITTPHKAKVINGYDISFVSGVKIMVIRIIPYPPSLSKTAAKIIDPATGASTWAFGNHRWAP